MSIAKVLLLTGLLVLGSCSLTQEFSSSSSITSKCLEKRGAIDIGSGTSKLVLAIVNKCDQTIDHILFEAQRAISFKEALQKSHNNSFNQTIKNKAVSLLNELSQLAKNQGVTKIRAVATSAFRTAKNAKETKSYIEKRTGIKIKIITQTDEALFGYNSAISTAKAKKLLSNKPVAVWDIGGGSMQIVTKNKDHKKIYLGKLASVTFKNKVIQDLYSTKRLSPNPIGHKRAIGAMDIARGYANKHAKPILKSLKNYQVFGVGGVHFFSVNSQLQNSKYEQGSLLDTLLKRSELSDKQIKSKYAATDVTNLALVLGFMQSLLINEVTPLKINMAHGVLTTKSLWN